MTTNVAKKIKESLLNTSELNFLSVEPGHPLLSAKDVSYSSYSNQLTVTFEDFDVHGNVDGGHPTAPFCNTGTSWTRGSSM